MEFLSRLHKSALWLHMLKKEMEFLLFRQDTRWEYYKNLPQRSRFPCNTWFWVEHRFSFWSLTTIGTFAISKHRLMRSFVIWFIYRNPADVSILFSTDKLFTVELALSRNADFTWQFLDVWLLRVISDKFFFGQNIRI